MRCGWAGKAEAGVEVVAALALPLWLSGCCVVAITSISKQLIHQLPVLPRPHKQAAAVAANHWSITQQLII